MKILKKILPFSQARSESPFHAGEVYYLWETLTTFKHFLSSEIEYFQQTMSLATARNVLDNPPVVTSKRG